MKREPPPGQPPEATSIVVGEDVPGSLPPEVLALIVEQCGDGIIVADAAGVIRAFNPAAERQHGVQKAAVAAPAWASTYGLFALDGRPLPLEETPLYRALHGERVAGARWRVRRGDGSFRILSGTATPLVHPDGSSAGAVIVTRDETDRVALEEERRRSEALRLSDAVLRQVPDGIILTDLAGNVLRFSRGAENVFGYSAAEMIGRPVNVVHRADVREAMTAEIIRQVRSTGEFLGDIPCVRKDGVEVLIEASVNTLLDDQGEAIALVGVNRDVTRRRQTEEDRTRLEREQAARLTAEAAENRFRFLAEASAVLAESLDYEQTLRRVAELAVPRIADWCSVAVVDRQGVLRRVSVVHKEASKRALAARYRDEFPPQQHRAREIAGVLERGEPVLKSVVTDEDLAASAQDPRHLQLLRDLGCTSLMMLPMVVRGEGVGVISFMIGDDARKYTSSDLSFAQEIGHRAAVAIDNARLYREIHRREETTRFLAEASAMLASSLDYESTLQSLARVAVPRFADWCTVEILEDGAIRQVAVAHVDPAKVAIAREFQRRWPTDPDAATGTPNIIRTGKSALYEDIPDEILVAGTRDAEHLRMARELRLRSALSVPLMARGRTLGALSLVWAESGRRYTRDDLPLMEELGRRAAIAVDNARLYREARNAIELRDEFLSIAGHELKTPLTALQLQVGSLLAAARKGALTDPARLEERLGKTDAHGRRLNRLINELLDVSRITAGRLTLELEPVDLGQLAQEVLERFADDAQRGGTQIAFACAEPVVVEGDALRIDQVLTNLVSNAIKYGRGKPVTVTIARADEVARITVTDRGIGIAPAHQERIFGRFERAVSERHFGGFGLGLWITSQIVTAHGGTVSVASTPGQGATFTVALPVSQPEAATKKTV